MSECEISVFKISLCFISARRYLSRTFALCRSAKWSGDDGRPLISIYISVSLPGFQDVSEYFGKQADFDLLLPTLHTLSHSTISPPALLLTRPSHPETAIRSDLGSISSTSPTNHCFRDGRQRRCSTPRLSRSTANPPSTTCLRRSRLSLIATPSGPASSRLSRRCQCALRRRFAAHHPRTPHYGDYRWSHSRLSTIATRLEHHVGSRERGQGVA